MKRLLIALVGVLVVMCLGRTGYAQAPPGPAPTKPTAAPKVDFPTKGKAITLIVPWAPGGAADVGARLLADGLEKALKVPVRVVNIAGASGQVGLTELVIKSKPDGYTLGLTIFASTITTYLDPVRKAVFTRDSFVPVALQVSDPAVVCVNVDSPHKNLKDLVDAAKAKPWTVGTGTGGLMTTEHLALLQLEQVSGAKFNPVHLNGSAQAMTTLLGGHVDAIASLVSQVLGPFKARQIRVLAVFDREQSKFLPAVPTAESQGYKVHAGAFRGFSAPAGTPKDIVEILSAGIRQAMESEQMKRKMEDSGQGLRFMDAAQYTALWAETEAKIKPLMSLAK